jgi:hypothetical protein
VCQEGSSTWSASPGASVMYDESTPRTVPGWVCE